ncbi:adenylate cyclase class 2 [Methanomicrobium sp. W14]|uniref:class IV adenylate cyclase n=1 Tax=Methanomicrobium sp. W14 TaxID=2817839 RepID=UPI001AE26169|nr:class IV adenylate cyclase [Methanomicrobium sp. W14]MBP2132997.1 adenylate cyclase class 2 [Methanomicrobium sp. W14]
MLEVEAKIKVSSIDKIRDELTNKKAGFLGKNTQKDLYYNAPDRDFAKTDEALRVRISGDSYELTYKGAKIKGTGAKAREEFNVTISSAEDMENILERLGFIKSSSVFKTREEYSFRGTTVALDIVEELGCFTEIEVITDDRNSALSLIDSVKSELSITGDIIRKSYLELVLEKKGQ